MDIEKFKIWRTKTTPYEEAYKAKVKEVETKLEEKKKQVKAIVTSKAWPVLEEYFDARVNLLKEKLVREDSVEARAAIQEVRALYQFFKNYLVD